MELRPTSLEISMSPSPTWVPQLEKYTPIDPPEIGPGKETPPQYPYAYVLPNRVMILALLIYNKVSIFKNWV